MTYRVNTFESGLADGTALTAANSGGSAGTAFGLVNNGTGSTLVFSTTTPMSGTRCALLTPAASVACEVRWTDFNAATLVASWYHRWDTAVDMDGHEFFRFYTGANRAVSGVIKTTSGQINFNNSAAASVWASTNAVAANTWYRFEAYCKPGPTGTTDGEAEFAYYLGDSATPVQAMARVTNISASTGNITVLSFGKTNGTGAGVNPRRLDAVQANDGATTFIGPYVAGANVVPTVTAGATQTLTSGTTASVMFTADDTDGTIASFQTPTVTSSAATVPTVGAPTLTGIGTSHATATYPVSGLTNSDTTISNTATDNAGGVSAAVSTRVIRTSLNPTRRSVTLNGVTMTTPTSGNAVDALNNQASVPVSFTTAGPPAAGAGVVEAFQPLDSASVPPNFGQYWAASDTVTPITVYVDLKFNGTTQATASATLTNTTPVFVGRNCTSAENTAIGADRSTPMVASRFS